MHRLGAAVLVLVLAACSPIAVTSAIRGEAYDANPGMSAVLRFAHRGMRPGDTNGGLHWLSSQGLGEAIADCGSSWVAIAGGAFSATATDVGTGFPGNTGSTWIAYSATSNARLTAYVLCAPPNNLSAYFYRKYAQPSKKRASTASVACNGKDMFVSGWAYGAKSEGPLIKNGVPIGWVAAGSSKVTSLVECATYQEWSGTGMLLLKQSGSNRLFVSCNGDDDDVIGGAFGSGASSGPPELQYPGASNGVASGIVTGFWFVSRQSNTGWVSCQRDN